MSAIKISSKVDEKVWGDLKDLAAETGRSVSGVLTEAIAEYLRCRRVRPQVLEQIEASIADNRELGRLLAE